MFELNKFQIFTVIFLLMFVFVIGAIYTNTKEVAESRMGTMNISKNENLRNYVPKHNDVLTPQEERITNLYERVGVLEQRLSNELNENANNNLKCRVEGIMDGDEFISISRDEALEEARHNGKDIVMLCNF